MMLHLVSEEVPVPKANFLAGQRPKVKASSELQGESVDSWDQEFRQLLTFWDEEPCPSEGPHLC